MDNLTEKELKAVFDVVNVFEPEDISHVYPEMASDEFMQDVMSAWKKMLNSLDNTTQNWENTIMKTIDITPTWASLILPMIEVLKNPKASKDSKTEITYELIRLAKIVDAQNERAKQNG